VFILLAFNSTLYVVESIMIYNNNNPFTASIQVDLC